MTITIFPIPAAATGLRGARPCRPPSASGRSSNGCAPSALMPMSARPSTGANGTRPAFIPASSGRWRISKARCRWCRKRTCAKRSRASRPSATTCAFPSGMSSISTAPAAPPAGRPLSPSAAPTGAPSPTPTPASCGAWACVPAIRSASPRFSRSIWGAGERLPAPSGSAPNAFRSAPARPACRRAACNGSI